MPLGVGAGGDDKGAGVAKPLGVGADGDDKGVSCKALGPVSAVDRVNSTVATPSAGVAGAGVEGTRPGAGVSGVTPATGGTKSAGPDPWPDRVGAAETNGARAKTTTKPMTVPTPVCASFDGTATSPVTCDQSRPAGPCAPNAPQRPRVRGYAFQGALRLAHNEPAISAELRSHANGSSNRLPAMRVHQSRTMWSWCSHVDDGRRRFGPQPGRRDREGAEACTIVMAVQPRRTDGPLSSEREARPEPPALSARPA